jgi:hypothetical protein
LGFFQNSNDLVCLPCHPACLTCQNITQCETCDAQNDERLDIPLNNCTCKEKTYI